MAKRNPLAPSAQSEITKEEMEKNEMSAPATTQPGSASETLPVISESTVKQPQTVLDLDTGLDAKITVEYKRYEVNEKNKTATAADRFAAAEALVTPIENQTEALLRFASNASYNAGKNVALSAGNYLTSELRRMIVNLLSNNAQFAELKPSDIADRWLAGYKAKSPKAIEWLNRAKSMLTVEDLDF